MKAYRQSAEKSHFPVSAGEQRRAARKAIFADVWVDPGGTAMATAHKVLDISATGAKLLVTDGLTLPDRFFLRVGPATHVAQVVWRGPKRVGVRFERSEM